MAGPVGVYISVPFCKAKCTFCNFASGVFGGERMESYVARLCGEIRTARASAVELGAELPEMVDTLYFGGGTPSLLSAQQFREIFAHLRGEFEIAAGAEITLECAPGQLGEETLEELLRQGVNRVSFGVQSFVDVESAAVGRLHTAAECTAEIARVRAAGVEEISLDLIAGLPHQTEASWRYSVERVVESDVPHASVYLLEVDEDSRLGREMLEQGSRYGAAAVASEDETAAWYQYACEAFGAAGIHQYEISNFARDGHCSRHNLKYWRRDPYLGLGLDAHSMLHAPGGDVRFANTSDLDGYMAAAGDVAEESPLRIVGAGGNAPEVDRLGVDEAFEESLFLGLRLNEGVDLRRLREDFGERRVREAMISLREVREAGLLEFEAERIRLTPHGRLVSNEVFSRLLVAEAV